MISINVKSMNVPSNVKTWLENNYVQKLNNYGVYVHIPLILVPDNGIVPISKFILLILPWNMIKMVMVSLILLTVLMLHMLKL